MNGFLIAALGGFLLGLASVLLMLFLGRISGISGIFFSALQGMLPRHLANFSGNSWRWLFLIGLVLGPVVSHQLFSLPVPEVSTAAWWQIILAGFLVGLGTKLGSGCTSGHGVCGIARFSMRSIVATLVFMLAGMLVVLVLRHLV